MLHSKFKQNDISQLQRDFVGSHHSGKYNFFWCAQNFYSNTRISWKKEQPGHDSLVSREEDWVPRGMESKSKHHWYIFWTGQCCLLCLLYYIILLSFVADLF